GYPIEIQALWNNALNLMSEHDSAGDWNVLSEKVIASIEKYYSLSGKTYLSDCLHASPGQSAAQAIPDDACRPNQLFAITLNAIRNRDIGISVLRSCECLIVPGAIRSLADAPVDFAQPILHNGKLLNKPERPYWGQYIGDEDTKRKPAYHNGTAWTWPFPSFCEAMFMLEPSTKKRALALLLSGISQMRAGIPGQLPEIVDGNAPHHWRGCAAQAWGMSEMYRVYQLLTAPEKTFKENS
ncbi:MAG: amylo-alpha-1,6-glucosidase, partial [Victivallaceae bacterium]